jgi:hypothetical protein
MEIFFSQKWFGHWGWFPFGRRPSQLPKRRLNQNSIAKIDSIIVVVIGIIISRKIKVRIVNLNKIQAEPIGVMGRFYNKYPCNNFGGKA